MLHNREKAIQVYSEIEGVAELLSADPSTAEKISPEYPDAFFALHVLDNLFQHDREMSLIYQKAYNAILNEESIPCVRHRFDKDFEQYVIRHNWDN